jgi:hypothetical protein
MAMLVVLLAAVASGCAAAPGRPAPSTIGCAEAVVAALPPGLTDLERHCLASAGIARQCSAAEAWLAGWAKETRDALGGGDAAREDLAANRHGRRCAAESGADGDLLDCCRRALEVPLLRAVSWGGAL